MMVKTGRRGVGRQRTLQQIAGSPTGGEMATSPEPKWRTALTVTAAVLGIVLTTTAIVTNVFGILEKSADEPDSSATSASATAAATPAAPADRSAGAGTQLSEEDAVRIAERKTSEWLAGWQDMDVDTLASLAEFPFVYRGEYVVSQRGLADKYSAAFGGSADWAGGPVTGSTIDRIEPRTIGDLDDQGWHVRVDPPMDKLRLRDNDIGVAVYYSDPEVEDSGGLTMLVFRRSAEDLGLVGVVDIGE